MMQFVRHLQSVELLQSFLRRLAYDVCPKNLCNQNTHFW